MLQAALNGMRRIAEHPAVPVTPEQLAADAAAVRAAGAHELHVHPRDADGRESLLPGVVGPAVAAIRAAAPGMPVGVTTGAWIEPDPERLLAQVRSWGRLSPGARPDYASVNLSEPAAPAVMAALEAAGVGIEAGVALPDEVALLAAPGVPALLRVLVEPGDEDPMDAVALAWMIDERLAAAGVGAPRLHHGAGPATWAVLAATADRDVDVRVGLEDVLTLPDGRRAAGNVELVTAVPRA